MHLILLAVMFSNWALAEEVATSAIKLNCSSHSAAGAGSSSEAQTKIDLSVTASLMVDFANEVLPKQAGFKTYNGVGDFNYNLTVTNVEKNQEDEVGIAEGELQQEEVNFLRTDGSPNASFAVKLDGQNDKLLFKYSSTGWQVEINSKLSSPKSSSIFRAMFFKAKANCNLE